MIKFREDSSVQIAEAIHAAQGTYHLGICVGAIVDQEVIDCPTYQSGWLGQAGNTEEWGMASESLGWRRKLFYQEAAVVTSRDRHYLVYPNRWIDTILRKAVAPFESTASAVIITRVTKIYF